MGGVVLAVLVGVPVALGLGLEKLSRGQTARRTASLGVIALAIGVALWIGYSGYGWRPGMGIDSLKYLLPAVLPLPVLWWHQRRLSAERDGLEIGLPEEKTQLTCQLLFGGIFMWLFPVVMQAAFPALVTRVFWRSTQLWWADLGYYGVSCLVLAYAIVIEAGYASVIRGIKAAISANDGALNLDATSNSLHKHASQIAVDDVKAIVLGVANAANNAGLAELIELRGTIWLFNKSSFVNGISQYRTHLEQMLRHDPEAARRQIANFLPVPAAEAHDYFDRYLDFADQCDFSDGTYTVAHTRQEDLNRCCSCGVVQAHGGARNDEWYCSPVCQDTEKVCNTIREKPLAEFLGEASTTGFVAIAVGGAWSQNHKMVAAGGQGHGFAAEKANNMHDRLTGKSAKIVGDDNAKNGADRIVDGQKLQTKYCSTGARSIGAAFDNKTDGNFRYYDANNNPMPIEVPRDQYDKAVETMRSKIGEGKVPGVKNPDQAEKLVVKGHLTYEQARNITKFGTFESIRFDMQEGAIVSLGAGGISFGITATISYLNTNDTKAALRAACMQGGKTFGRTLIVYVGTQQLHRLATVQAAVKYVSVGKISAPMANALQKSMGVTTRGQLDRAFQGTVVASLVIVAVTSGPDLLKMVRGRMSGAQFTKNLAVAASSTAGGAVGAIAGGALGASFGPVGIWAGKIAGGVVGGAIAGALTNTVAKSMMKEDGECMLEIVQRQVEYLAILFMLTETEIDNLSINLNSVVTPQALERMYASDAQKAFANFLVKPLVVGIVKQRPSLRYDINDVIESFDGKPLISAAANNTNFDRAVA
ncbi:hypothetical protein DBA20_02610 [Pandoraea capi]|nr:hypothetical protein [Pandoraea sp. LA3]MDN4581879.1 hypothetical protein [Pandoraea capi]